MNKQVNTMSKDELKVVQGRVAQVFSTIEAENDLERGLIAYAVANGYTEEEAQALVVDTIIPTVSNYNAMCRSHVESQDHGWFFDHLKQATSDMSLADECKFKLGILTALHGANASTLSRVGVQTKDEQEAEYQALSENELAQLDAADYNEEILAEIDRQLDAALDAISLDAEMMEQIDRLIEDQDDDEAVHGFVTKLWQDESYKYCAALAGCVARRNREFPSIPEDADDVAVIVGVCQGIDAANVAVRVSKGELALDKAFAILRTIALVGLCILATAAITAIAVTGTLLTIGVVVNYLGCGLVASVVALAAGGVVLFGIIGDLPKTLEVVGKTFCKIADCTYGMLKEGVKAAANFVKARVIPKLKEFRDKAIAFVTGLKHRMANQIARRANATV